MQPWCTPFPIWNYCIVPCLVLTSFFTCIQVAQETGKAVWYSHVLKNFPQFVVIHMVKGFSIVSEAEVDVFWNSLAFSMIQHMLAIWLLVPLYFLNRAWISGSSPFMYCWNLSWWISRITLLACEMSAIVWHFELSFAESVILCGFQSHRWERDNRYENTSCVDSWWCTAAYF